MLKNQVRYAGIRATSRRLHTMCITRTDFERALGCKLEDCLPDKFKLDQAELVTALRKVDLFKGFKDEHFTKLAGIMKEFSWKQVWQSSTPQSGTRTRCCSTRRSGTRRSGTR